MGSYFLGGLVASLNLFVLAAKAGVRKSHFNKKRNRLVQGILKFKWFPRQGLKHVHKRKHNLCRPYFSNLIFLVLSLDKLKLASLFLGKSNSQYMQQTNGELSRGKLIRGTPMHIKDEFTFYWYKFNLIHISSNRSSYTHNVPDLHSAPLPSTS